MRFLNIFIVIVFLNSCSPIYVLEAAYTQGKILAGRKKIDTVINDPDTKQTEKQKLELVLAARTYAEKIGLKPGKSYLTYTKLDQDVLSWIVMAATPDSFTIKTWWFPFVGRVPYKGFFSQSDAKRAALNLENKGFETWVRPTEAYSTLGWFDDPVLTPLLKHEDVSIVNTIIHESVHQTFWLPGHVPFNESLANFIGYTEAVNFYRECHASCLPSDDACLITTKNNLTQSSIALEKEFEFATLVQDLYNQLETLYKSNISKEEKLAKRTDIFSKAVAQFKERYPKSKAFNTLNNAEIMQFKIYLNKLPEFRQIYEKYDNNTAKMLEQMNKLKQSLKKDEDPFIVMQNL
jgi:predicted aminopeptidase